MKFFLSDEEVKDLKREKGIFDREMELYRRERNQAFDTDMATRRLDAQRDSFQARKGEEAILLDEKCSNLEQIGEMKRDFYKQKCEKEVEIAKLDTEILAKKDLIKKADSIPELESRAFLAEAESKGKDIAIEHLKEDVKRLDETMKFIAGLLPKLEFDKLGLNFTADLNVTQKTGKEEKKPQT